MSDDPMSEMPPPPRAGNRVAPRTPTATINLPTTVNLLSPAQITPPKAPMTTLESEEEPTGEDSEAKGQDSGYDSDNNDLLLQFKLTEYSIIKEITGLEHTLEKQRAEEVKFKASLLEEVRVLAFKVDTTVAMIQENQDSLLALLNRATALPATALPPTPVPAIEATAKEESAEGPSTKQVGAGRDTDSQVADSDLTLPQVGGGCAGLLAKPHPMHPTPPKPENIPISVEELASIKQDDNLQYAWVYPTYNHTTPYKIRVANMFLSDVEEVLRRGGTVFPHKKLCRDWDLFVAERKRWAARQHFTHCRDKS